MKLIEWTIDENDEKSGVDFVALVDQPAITLNYQVFSKDGKPTGLKGVPLVPEKFAIDKERRIIAGPVMIPNLPIPRSDEQYGEYSGFFSKDTIRKIRDKYMRKKYTDNVNLMHEAGLTVDDVYMVDCFIIDEGMGYMTPKNYGHELTDGTWWMGFKVSNDEVLEVVKDQVLKGFSVEGRFIDNYLGEVEDPLLKQLEEIILGNKVAK